MAFCFYIDPFFTEVNKGAAKRAIAGYEIAVEAAQAEPALAALEGVDATGVNAGDGLELLRAASEAAATYYIPEPGDLCGEADQLGRAYGEVGPRDAFEDGFQPVDSLFEVGARRRAVVEVGQDNAP